MAAWVKLNRVATLGLVLLLGLTMSPARGAAVSPTVLTDAERFILEMVQRGQIANLAQKFGPDETRRKVRAEFLSQLLTGERPNTRVHRHGIQIAKAVITSNSRDLLDLANATVPYEVKLTDCVFDVKVNFEATQFKHNLRLDQSEFRQEAHFLKMRVDKGLFLPMAVFQDLVNFNGVDIGDSINAEGARFESATPKYFGGLKARSSAYFSKAKFSGPATFDLARVGALWDISEAEFHQKVSLQGLHVGATLWSDKTIFRGAANFSLMEVNNFAHFEGAAFHGSAKFGRAWVGKDFLAKGVKFLSQADQDYASFFYSKVGSLANFQDALFRGPVDFSGMEVGLELRADRAQFLHAKLGLEAIGLKVGTIANFTKALFAGPVNFSGAVIEGQLNASQATFQKQAEFPGVTVSELAEFSDTIFVGPVNLSGSKIGGKLLAHVQESGTILAGGIFKGPVKLQDARLFDLVLQGKTDTRGITDPSVAKEVTITELDLDRTVVERTLTIENVIVGKLSAWNLTSKGQTTLENVAITGEADLRDSKFLNLVLNWVVWPTPGTRKVRLAGMTYQALAMETPPPASVQRLWDWLFARSPGLDWLDHSRFDKGNYLQLERFLERSGHQQLADKVYISMKRREMWPQTWYEWLNPVFWFTLIFWDAPVGYGRKPLRIIWFALTFVLAGAYVFDPRDLKGVERPRREIFRRLLLSLDKFTPTMWDLGMDKKWHPHALSTRMEVYNYFHKLMGRVFLALFFFGVWAYFK